MLSWSRISLYLIIFLLSCLQKPITGFCTEPDDSTRSHYVSWKFVLIYSFHLRQDIPSYLFIWGFPIKTYMLFSFLQCLPSRPHWFYLRNNIWWMEGQACIFGTSSLCKFSHSPVTFSLSLSRSIFSRQYAYPALRHLQEHHLCRTIFVLLGRVVTGKGSVKLSINTDLVVLLCNITLRCWMTALTRRVTKAPAVGVVAFH